MNLYRIIGCMAWTYSFVRERDFRIKILESIEKRRDSDLSQSKWRLWGKQHEQRTKSATLSLESFNKLSPSCAIPLKVCRFRVVPAMVPVQKFARSKSSTVSVSWSRCSTQKALNSSMRWPEVQNFKLIQLKHDVLWHINTYHEIT